MIHFFITRVKGEQNAAEIGLMSLYCSFRCDILSYVGCSAEISNVISVRNQYEKVN